MRSNNLSLYNIARATESVVHNVFRRGNTQNLVMMDMSHKDGDPDKTKEEYDDDNHADQENPNNDEYDKDARAARFKPQSLQNIHPTS
jgi:hypothetical protein